MDCKNGPTDLILVITSAILVIMAFGSFMFSFLIAPAICLLRDRKNKG
jgi:hypothetical protein